MIKVIEAGSIEALNGLIDYQVRFNNMTTEGPVTVVVTPGGLIQYIIVMKRK